MKPLYLIKANESLWQKYNQLKSNEDEAKFWVEDFFSSNEFSYVEKVYAFKNFDNQSYEDHQELPTAMLAWGYENLQEKELQNLYVNRPLDSANMPSALKNPNWTYWNLVLLIQGATDLEPAKLKAYEKTIFVFFESLSVKLLDKKTILRILKYLSDGSPFISRHALSSEAELFINLMITTLQDIVINRNDGLPFAWASQLPD